MTLNELIARLEYFQNLFGNIPVEIESENGYKPLTEACVDKDSLILYIS